MSEANKQKLPSGWAATTLGTVQLDLAFSVDPARTPDTIFELYSVPSHERGVPEIVTGKCIGSSKKVVQPNTVLLCKINPRINRVWVTGDHSTHCKIASTEWIPFFPLSHINPNYLAYFLRRNSVRDFLATNASGVGGSLMRVKAETLKDFEFYLAPKNEQTRIAETLDELFSDLDAGVMALESARKRLKLYRTSVLKAAVEGSLTADWRDEHPNIESAKKLLKHILVKRRRLWEEDQIRKFSEKGRTPPKNWRAEYKEPVAPDTTDLPQLPDGWCWATVDQCSSMIQYGSSARANRDKTGIPVLRMGNITSHGNILLDDIKYLQRDNDKLSDLILTRGDILFNRTNSADLVGKTAMYSGNPSPCSFASYLIRVRLLDGISPVVLVCALNGAFGKAWIKKVATQTVGQANVNGTKLASFAFPLPPAEEQNALVEAVEDQLSIVDHLETDLDAKLKANGSLRQAILHRAFTGKLVPQNPDDEPASELLDRIAAERATQAGRR